MPNEVKIVVTDQYKPTGGFAKADAQVKNLEKSAGNLADRGMNRARTATSSFLETAGKGAAVLAGVTAAAATVNQVMGDGIAVSLSKANAQVSLGDKGFAQLSSTAAATANEMGLTESEFLRMGGQAASLAKNLGFSQEAAASFGSALPTLGSRLSILSNGQTSAADAADQLRSAIAGEFDPLQAMGIAISAASVQTEAMAIKQASATEITEQQATAMAVLAIVQRQTADASKVMGTEAGKAARDAAAAQAELRQSYEELSAKAVPALSKITSSTADFVTNITGAIDSSQSWQDRLGGLAEASESLVNPLKFLTDKLKPAREETEAQSEASAADAVNVAALGEGAKGAAASQEDLAKATTEAVDAIRDQVNLALEGRDAARGYQEALDEATDALKENGATLDITTEAGRANSEALDAIARSALEQADAVRDAGGTEEDYRGQLERSRSALIEQAQKFGMSETAAKAYANQLLGIPRDTKTKITLDNAGALHNINQVRIKMAALNGTTSYVYIRETTYRSAVDIAHDRGEKAAGGPVGAAAAGGVRGGMTLVGENGPELVPLRPGTMVHPASNTRTMLSRGGGQGEPMMVRIEIGGSRLADLLIDPIRQEVRTTGQGVTAALGPGRAAGTGLA